jgi:glycosyltransferase involved in cell wall biosynthesis
VTATARSLWFAIPGDIDARTGGYGYDRKMIDGLRARGWSVSVCRLDETFPMPSPAARAGAARILADLPDAALVLIDGLAFGAMADDATRERDRLRLIALVHHPLASETGLSPAQAAALTGSERRALAAARLVIVTSRATGDALGAYGVPASHIVVVEPGTERAPVARGSGTGVLNFLCVAAVVPRKGYETLIEAFAAIPDRSWTLTCVGSLDRSPETAARVLAMVQAHRLGERVRLAGELDVLSLAVHYDRADVFVLPTFHEGYGMAVAEALARGLPVVSTGTGAIADLVRANAGVLVPPGDAKALSRVLRDLIDHPDWRDRLAEGARQARLGLPTWEQAVDRMATALEQVDVRG